MFYALIAGSGGCDYTIDCGKTFKILNADIREDAVEECIKLFDGYGGQERVDEIQLIEVATHELIDLDKVIRDREETADLEKREKQEKKDREEYKRLHEKYGKDNT